LHRQPYWRDRYHLSDKAFPVATAQFSQVVSLPIFSAMSDAQVEQVVDTVRSVLA
jgi:dTDP-4-amino-4,6-dideoxygalactose transaminase